MPEKIDKKTVEAVKKFAETFSKLPSQAQKEVVMFAIAAKAIYETKEINENYRGG